MNIDILRTELTTDPLARGYAPMSNQAAADSLNTANRVLRVLVPFKIFARWASKGGRLDAITAAQTSGATAAIRGACRYIVLLLGAGQGIDPDNADDVAAINAITGAGLPIQAADRTELSALANQPAITRAAELGLPFVGAHHVALARA